jgi:putative SOS response-associated peptidase YedK
LASAADAWRVPLDPAPVVRNVGAVLELTIVRWGMPPTKVRRAAGHQ